MGNMGVRMISVIKERIRLIQKQIKDLEARLPAHSIPQSMVLELDELEDELARLMAELNNLDKEDLGK